MFLGITKNELAFFTSLAKADNSRTTEEARQAFQTHMSSTYFKNNMYASSIDDEKHNEFRSVVHNPSATNWPVYLNATPRTKQEVVQQMLQIAASTGYSLAEVTQAYQQLQQAYKAELSDHEIDAIKYMSDAVNRNEKSARIDKDENRVSLSSEAHVQQYLAAQQRAQEVMQQYATTVPDINLKITADVSELQQALSELHHITDDMLEESMNEDYDNSS